jgi:hypothetical protein
MAIAPLEQRLDKVSQELQDADTRREIAETQPLPEPSQPEIAPMEDEGVLVASKISEGLKLLKKLRKAPEPPPPRIEPQLTPEAQQVQSQQDAAKAATSLGLGDQPTAKVVTKVEASKRARPKVTPESVAAAREVKIQERPARTPEADRPPLAQFNLNRMETTEEVKATVDAINDQLGIKVKTIKFEEVKEAAIKAGMDMTFISQLTSPGKLIVNPENTYRALNAMTASAIKLDGYMQKIASNTATLEEKAEAAQWVHFHSILQESVKGYTGNIAQSLSIMRIPRDGRVPMQTITESLGTETDLVKFAQAYLDAGTPEGKAKLITKMATGTPWEKAFTVYVNSLLMGTGTLVKNFLSSAIYTPYRMAERSVAAGIGAARQVVGLGSADRYRIQEVGAMMVSSRQAIADGWQMAKYSFARGYPQDWIDPDKIARSQQRLQLFKRGDPRFWRPEVSLLDAGLWGLNAAITLPGRTILSTDQFFKGINYRYELVAEQTRAALSAADEARLAGASEADVRKAAEAASDAVAMNPPEFLHEMAAASTFSQRVEGKLGAVLAEMSPTDPLRFALRTQIPFLSAPINVISAVVERTPLAFASKNIQAAIKMGGKEGDMALAKVGMAGAAMYTLSQYGQDFMTGSGPGNTAQREAMVRQGWQPYSFMIDVSDGVSEDLRKRLAGYPGAYRFGSGDYEGKLFLSYQGLEPVGAMLAMASDYNDYVKYENDDSRINAFVGGTVYGFANYIMEHPMLTGIQNITALFGSEYATGSAKAIGIVDYVTLESARITQSIANPFTRPLRAVRQEVDPMVREYRLDPNAPAGLRGLMDGLNKFKADTPGWSDSLPPKLNIWSEPVTYEYAWSPLRVKEGKMRKADQGLIAMGARVGMPSNKVSMKDPVTGIDADTQLLPEEYNEMLRIANRELDLESQIEEVLSEVKVNSITDKNDLIFYQIMVDERFKKVFSTARQMVLMDSQFSAQIQSRIADKAQQLKQLGLGAR